MIPRCPDCHQPLDDHRDEVHEAAMRHEEERMVEVCDHGGMRRKCEVCDFRAEVGRLKEALETFGRYTDDCKHDLYDFSACTSTGLVPCGCTCGLDDARRGKEAEG